MEGDRLLKGGDTVTDDLLHLAADHIFKQEWYYFKDGPVELPRRRYWKESTSEFEILKNWLERKRATSVQDLINTVRHWEKDGKRDHFARGGYINSEVWEKLRDKVDLDSIKSEETPGEIRLLTGQDEVTNNLMDTVARYIKEPMCPHFAIEQLGLTWENVSTGYSYPDAEEVFRIWYWEHCIGGITTETFLIKVKKWEHARFISREVWSHMNDIVDSETIKNGLSTSIEDEFVKLSDDDKVTERVLSCVSRHIDSSRLREFAMEILQLKYPQYREARSVLKEDEMISNLEILICWYKLQTEGIIVKTFLQMLKKWEAAGFITSDVWSNLNDTIDSHTIQSVVCAFSHENKDNGQLSLEDNPDNRLLGCVAHCVLDSHTLHFTVDMLGLLAQTYSQIERDCGDDKHLRNKMLLLEWRNHHEELSVKEIVNRFSNWVQQGYVDGNVWTDISEFVSHAAVASALSSDCSTTSTHNEESVLKQNQMDRMLSHVSQYIYPSELREFAVKRLGLRETRYETIEEDYIYAKRRNFEVLQFWSENINPLEPKIFIGKVLQWQRAGYVSKDVWNEMDKIVSPDLLPSQEEIDRIPESLLETDSHEQAVKEGYDTDDEDEQEKLSSTDKINEFVLILTYQNIYPSKRKEFALQVLGLTKSEYSHINNKTKGAEQKNEQVMDAWYMKNRTITVSDFTEHVATWVEAGFISTDAWLDLQRDIRSDALRPYIQTALDVKNREKEENDWFSQLQRRTKRSIRIRCWSALSTEWMPEDKAKTFPLQDYPVQFELISDKGNRMSTKHLSFERIEDMFDMTEKERHSKVLLKGVAAMGKTYTLAAFANEWAQEGTENKKNTVQLADIRSFGQIFLLRLRNVTSNAPLESIIAEQHELFKEQESQLKTILEGSIKYRVLLCFDGYDEYTPGTNEAIDQAISSPNENYSTLLTSRPGQHVSRRVTDQMNCQVQLEGFDNEEIKKCAGDYLGKLEEAQLFIKNLKNTGLNDLKKIPAFLLMMLQLHGKLDSLLKKKSEVIWNIIKMVIDRSVRRHFAKTVDEMENLNEMLYALGELSWNVLQKSTKCLVVNKSDIEKINSNILKLGLLQGALYDETSTDLVDLPERLSYPIKLFHEFLSGYYTSKEKQKSWKDFFPSWNDITKYGQVVLSACGLTSDPLPLLQHIHRMFIDWKARMMKAESDVDIQPEEELFASLAQETGVCLVPSLKHLSLEHSEAIASDQSFNSKEQLAFPMKRKYKEIEFEVVLLSGKAISLEDSEVSIDVPEGVEGPLRRKIHTDVSAFQSVIADEKECLAGPVLELHLDAIDHHKVTSEKRYRIKIPHCLTTEEQRSMVVVRCGDLQRSNSFKEILRRKQGTKAEPYFEVDEKHIVIYTNHFSQFVCSTCSKACDYIMAFPFGSLIPGKDTTRTTASVKVILCPSLYNIKVFWNELVDRQTTMKLYPLTDLNVGIDHKNFDPKASDVSIGLSVTSPLDWQPGKPTRKMWSEEKEAFVRRRTLRSAMDVDNCHTCKKHNGFPRNTATFDFSINEVVRSFDANVNVTVHAACNADTPKDEFVDYEDDTSIHLDDENNASGYFKKTHSSKQNQTGITENELSAISREMGPRSMETFARAYLGLDGDQIQTMSDSRRENREGFKFDILERWRNKNPGPNTRETLDRLLQQGGEEDALLDYRKVRKAWDETM